MARQRWRAAWNEAARMTPRCWSESNAACCGFRSIWSITRTSFAKLRRARSAAIKRVRARRRRERSAVAVGVPDARREKCAADHGARRPSAYAGRTRGRTLDADGQPRRDDVRAGRLAGGTVSGEPDRPRGHRRGRQNPPGLKNAAKVPRSRTGQDQEERGVLMPLFRLSAPPE